jgi:phosphoribosyl 1,2-cyclic phosphate phosphodiesterase
MYTPHSKLTFLGTGTSQGVPVIACDCKICVSADPKDKRTRASALIEMGGKTFVIDTGPDFRTQMLRERVSQLDAVFYTHNHKDHLAGMDDVRAFCFKQKMAMPIYASRAVQDSLNREFPYAFVPKEDRYPGAPSIDLRHIGYLPFEVEGFHVIPIKVQHGKQFIHGFRFGDVTYITDANHIAPEEIEKIRGSKVLVINALRTQPHHSHFTLQQALEVVGEIKPEQAYFTHISHLLGKHEYVQAKLPDGVFLAYDGLKVSVGQ